MQSSAYSVAANCDSSSAFHSSRASCLASNAMSGVAFSTAASMHFWHGSTLTAGMFCRNVFTPVAWLHSPAPQRSQNTSNSTLNSGMSPTPCNHECHRPKNHRNAQRSYDYPTTIFANAHRTKTVAIVFSDCHAPLCFAATLRAKHRHLLLRQNNGLLFMPPCKTKTERY